MLKLRGIVDGGQRYVRGWHGSDPVVATSLGVELHPGSINVFVSTAGCPELAGCGYPLFRRTEDEDVSPPGIRRRGSFLVRDCKVNGVPAFILRTEHPGKAYDGPGRVVPTRLPQPNTMLEIVGPEIPGIAYGAEVDLELDPDPAKLRTVTVR